MVNFLWLTGIFFYRVGASLGTTLRHHFQNGRFLNRPNRKWNAVKFPREARLLLEKPITDPAFNINRN